LGFLLLATTVIMAVWLYPKPIPVPKEQIEVRPVGEQVRLYRHAGGIIETMPLEDYVVGVVAAEMPASFPFEALKAQAVAARTYTLRRVVSNGVENNPHPGADVCDDPRHSQAYYSRRELKETWGPLKYYRYYYKIKQAVNETAGVVITYSGQLIDPVYHASCGGCTENAGDVWKYDIPYLKSVVCPYDDHIRLNEEKSFTFAELKKALVSREALASTSGQSKTGALTLMLTEKTATGRPKEIAVSGVPVAATVMRERLGLKSTRFTWDIQEDRVSFATVGYGHGVGLCQYGAKGLAEHGSTFDQILHHYYTGVCIVDY
jgi:stage II sporulation protein D